MAKRTFTEVERWAVFLAHKRRCYICAEPLPFSEMTVDHIIPESMGDDQSALGAVIASFALPDDFSLNSYENWMPAHLRCNQAKGARPFRATPRIQLVLEQARKGALKAREFHRCEVTRRGLERALATVQQAATSGQLTSNDLKTLAASLATIMPAPITAAADDDIAAQFTVMDDRSVLLTPSITLRLVGKTSARVEYT